MKTYLTIITYLCVAFPIFSQDKPDGTESDEQKREKIRARKIAFITDYLDLNAGEAQVFWPVYNEYNKKINELSSEKMKLMKQVKEAKTMISEKEAEIIADKIIDTEINGATLMKDYHVKFKKILPKIKVVRLYQAEHRFKKQLLRDMKGKHLHQYGKGHTQDQGDE